MDCFTNRSEVFNTTPIVKGATCFPDWWKKLEKPKFNFEHMVPELTMHYCSGIIDFYLNSICIKLWSDLAIKMTPDKTLSYRFSDGESVMDFHPHSQYVDYLSEEYQHIKMISPWLFKCKEDINWVWVGSQWNSNLTQDMSILSGVVNFKKQYGTNIQAVLKYDLNDQVNKIYNLGTPLVHIFPMSEKKIKIHNHLLTSSELSQVSKNLGTPVAFGKKYYKVNKIKKEQSKCPFHF